jgi:hypothetical protein
MVELEKIVRECHPFASSFKTAKEKYDEAERQYGKPPQFSVSDKIILHYTFFLACHTLKP